MPATIRVESGISAGTDFWIDRPVLRIGSDPQCEICVPSAEIAAHAATLEFRGGNYRVYNRGSSAVSVGTAVLQPGGSAVWSDEQPFVLPGDVRLVLSFDGDPRPSPRPETRLDDGYTDDDQIMAPAADPSTSSAAAPKKSSKTMVQLAVIAFCVVGMAALLTMDRSGETAAAERPTFEAIVESSLAMDEKSVTRTLLPHLQYAEAAVVRGNSRLALSRFSKLRDTLVRRLDSLPESDRPEVRKMLEYVEYRLSGLQ